MWKSLLEAAVIQSHSVFFVGILHLPLSEGMVDIQQSSIDIESALWQI